MFNPIVVACPEEIHHIVGTIILCLHQLCWRMSGDPTSCSARVAQPRAGVPSVYVLHWLGMLAQRNTSRTLQSCLFYRSRYAFSETFAFRSLRNLRVSKSNLPLRSLPSSLWAIPPVLVGVGCALSNCWALRCFGQFQTLPIVFIVRARRILQFILCSH